MPKSKTKTTTKSQSGKSVTVGGKTYSSASAYTASKLGGVNRRIEGGKVVERREGIGGKSGISSGGSSGRSSSGGGGSSGGSSNNIVSSRVIYEPGKYGDTTKTQITTTKATGNKTNVFVKDSGSTNILSGSVSGRNVKASSLSIPGMNLKSYKEQQSNRSGNIFKGTLAQYVAETGSTANTKTLERSGSVINTTGRTSGDILREARTRIRQSPDTIYLLENPKGIKPVNNTQRTNVLRDRVSTGIDGGFSGASISDIYGIQTTASLVQKRNVKLGQETPIGKFRPLNYGNPYLLPVEKPSSFVESLRRSAREADFQAQFRTQGPQRIFTGLKATGYGFAVGATALIREPIKTTTGIFNFGVSAVTKPRETGAAFGEQLRINPGGTIGEIAGGAAQPALFGKALSAGQSAYISTGSKYRPPQTVFDPKVLRTLETEGRVTLPKSKSIDESVFKFSRARDGDFTYVSTAAPQRLSGKVAGVGKKAAKGYEDPGIYVTPKGHGSPYFLQVTKAGSADYKFSLNPLAGKISLPTVTEFKTTGVLRYPRSVVKEPGFTGVQKFQEMQAGSGKAFITKRSEIGLGALPKKRFLNPVTRRIEIEKGTSELEAVIPVGQQFKATRPGSLIARVKGFEEYTIFQGKKIPIRTAELVTTGKSTPALSIRSSARFSRATKRGTYAYNRMMSNTKTVTSLDVLSSLSGLSRVSQSRSTSRLSSSRSSSMISSTSSSGGSSARRTGRSSIARSISSGGSSGSISRLFRGSSGGSSIFRPYRPTPQPSRGGSSRVSYTPGFSSYYTPGLPTYTTPGIPPPKEKGKVQTTNKKKVKRATFMDNFYNPSLSALGTIDNKIIRGKMPDILTGLKIRPVIS